MNPDPDFLDQEQGTLLKQPINIADLLGNGTNFEISPDFDEDFGAGDLPEGSDDDDDEELSKNVAISPWQNSFDELRSQMVQINENIYKRVVVPGNEELGAIPERARVSVHYNAYWEHESSPFDSTYLRGTPLTFYMHESEVLEGLAEAVRTMHANEEAQFVISYKLLFHEMGCPPRIKPKADGLFIIKLLKFTDVGDEGAVDELPAEDRKKFPFLVAKVKDVHLRGLDCFKLGKLHSAAKSFHRAVNALQCCNLANAEEEAEQKKFLLKLYTNLAVCYNKLNMPNKTCLMCKEIAGLCNYSQNCKALFQEGRALFMLGEYSRALEVLKKAQRLEPHNADINKEIKLLAVKYASYQENRKQIWSRAMGIINERQEGAPSAEAEPSKFDIEIRQVLKDFKEKVDIDKMNLPRGLTNHEVNSVRELAKEFDLKVSLNPLEHSEKVYTVIKDNYTKNVYSDKK